MCAYKSKKSMYTYMNCASQRPEYNSNLFIEID